MIIEKKGQKYLKFGDRAIPFDKYDKNGKPIIKPMIKRTKVKGKDKLTITIPSLKIKYKVNGKRNLSETVL